MYDIVSLGENSFNAASNDDNCRVLFVPLSDTIDTTLWKNTRVLHTGSSLLAVEPFRSGVYEAIDIAKNAGAIISYAPRFDASSWHSEADAMRFVRSLICTADILFATESELPLLTGASRPDKAADALADQGIRVILISQSSNRVFLRVGRESRILNTTLHDERLQNQFVCRFIASKQSLRALTLDEACDFLS